MTPACYVAVKNIDRIRKKFVICAIDYYDDNGFPEHFFYNQINGLLDFQRLSGIIPKVDAFL